MQKLYLPDRNRPVGEKAVEPEQRQYQAEHNMEKIVGGRPLKELLGEKVGIAGDKLVKIDGAEDQVKDDRGPFIPAEHYQHADRAKDNMENIIRGRVAGGGEFRRQNEAQYADQYQHGTEYS